MTILSVVVAVAVHSVLVTGSLSRVAEILSAHCASGAGGSDLTGRVRSTSASPGMQTDLHMSHSAVALSVMLVPAARSAGGVISTRRKFSPSNPLPVILPEVSRTVCGVGHWMSPALKPGGSAQVSAVT